MGMQFTAENLLDIYLVTRTYPIENKDKTVISDKRNCRVQQLIDNDFIGIYQIIID